MSTKKIIPFKGGYWWSDSKNVTDVLQKELSEILSETQVFSIEITGNDFSDGKEYRKITLEVSTIKNEIIVVKQYGQGDAKS